MKTILLPLLVASFLTAGFPPPASAQSIAPARINYQAYVTDSAGAPYDGSYDLLFKIYNTPTGGTALWGEKQTVIITTGRFSVILGNGVTIPNAAIPGPTGTGAKSLDTVFGSTTAAASGTLYIGITVGTASEFAPRQQLVSNPFSLRAKSAENAQTANSVSANGVNSAALASGAVTNDKLASNLNLSANGTTTGNFTGSFTGSFTTTGTSVFTGSGAGLTNLTAANLTGTLPAISGAALTNLSAANLTGDLPKISGAKLTDLKAAELTGALPAISGANLTNLNPSNLIAGGTLPVLDGRALTALNASQLTSGTIPDARLSLGIARRDGPNSFTGTLTLPKDGLKVKDSANGTIQLACGRGRVGIGTDIPDFPLHVIGTVSEDIVDGSYFNNTNNEIRRDPISDAKVSIRASGYIWASTGFIASSDRRIKTITGRSEPAADLDMIRRLQVTDYRMKDRVGDGDGLHKGFIAQEVQAVMPEAVKQGIGFVPDINAVAQSVAYDPAQKAVTVCMAKAHSLAEGDVVRVIGDAGSMEVAVLKVPDAATFLIGPVEKAPAKLFVYGRKVNDFLTVDYDRIFTTGIGAIQQLKNEQDTAVQKLEAENAKLREQLAVQAARLAALEATEAARDAKFAALEKRMLSAGMPAGRTVSLNERTEK